MNEMCGFPKNYLFELKNEQSIKTQKKVLQFFDLIIYRFLFLKDYGHKISVHQFQNPFLPRPRPLPMPLPPPWFQLPIVVFFCRMLGFLFSHFTFMNLHIRVSSTSIIAPSLSKSPIQPGALNMVTNLRSAKNS